VPGENYFRIKNTTFKEPISMMGGQMAGVAPSTSAAPAHVPTITCRSQNSSPKKMSKASGKDYHKTQKIFMELTNIPIDDPASNTSKKTAATRITLKWLPPLPDPLPDQHTPHPQPATYTAAPETTLIPPA
jgi:hypothetical protein